MSTPLPRRCYVLVAGAKAGNRIGLVYRGETGYVPLEDAEPDTGMPVSQLDAHIDKLNASLNVSREQRLAMERGSMFGVWSDPRPWGID